MKQFICTVLLVIFSSTVYGSDIQVSDIQATARNAEAKLKANHFLLTDEIDELYETEQTPGVWDKFSATRRK